MSQTEVQLGGFKWVDVINPTQAMLEELADQINLPHSVLLNCLDTDHLPHLETYGLAQFVLLRLMEPETKASASSVQSLTTKIALFLCPDQMITIHRLPLKEVDEIRRNIKEGAESTDTMTKPRLISLFYEQVALGFDRPLTDLEQKLQIYEEKLFNKRKSRNFLQEGFYLKRKASAFKKVLKLTLDLMAKLISKADCSPEHFQESKDRLERSLFYAEDVHENIQSLLNLHVAIESQKTNEASFKTNEIMRVLTVLTIFFLPLNFVAGIFGMNFTKIPFLHYDNGFWVSLFMMLAVSVALGYYLFKQGWLAKPEITSEKEKNERN